MIPSLRHLVAKDRRYQGALLGPLLVLVSLGPSPHTAVQTLVHRHLSSGPTLLSAGRMCAKFSD